MRYAWMPFLDAVLSARGGGGGERDGTQPPAPDLTGWWLLEADDLEEPVGYRQSELVPLADDGSTVVSEMATLQKDGWTLRADVPNATDPDRRVYRFDIVNPGLLEGRVEVHSNGTLNVGRLMRLTVSPPPDGELIVHGTLAGIELSIDTSTAHAAEFDDGSASTTVTVYDSRIAGSTYLALTYQAAPPLPAGAYDVGELDDEIGVICVTRHRPDFGSRGRVVLTQSTRTRVAGSYVVHLTDGGTITGGFDVPIRAMAARG